MARRGKDTPTGDVVHPGTLKGAELFAYNKGKYGETIRKKRVERGLNQQELARKIGITTNAITNWEAGRSRPDTNFIPSLCEVLGLTVSGFFGLPGKMEELSWREQCLVRDYRALPDTNRRVIDRALDTMIENEDKELRERCRNGFERIRRSGLSASAGIGYDLTGGPGATYRYVRVGREACRADEIITVSGDSMEPTFKHGDDLFVEYTQSIAIGEIGIFVAAGDGYVKEYRRDGLHSHNPAYAVLKFSEGDDVRCVGRVLGVVGKDQYATRLEIEILEEFRREGGNAGEEDEEG